MATEALRQRLIRGLTQRRLKSARWSDFASALTGLSIPDRNALVRILARGDALKFGRRTQRVLRNALLAQATTDVDAALADDTLTVAELEEMLGVS